MPENNEPPAQPGPIYGMAGKPPEPIPSKPWWQSKTILGAAAIVVVEAYRQFTQIDVGVKNVTDVFVGLGIAAGGILAIVGRIRATHTITK